MTRSRRAGRATIGRTLASRRGRGRGAAAAAGLGERARRVVVRRIEPRRRSTDRTAPSFDGSNRAVVRRIERRRRSTDRTAPSFDGSRRRRAPGRKRVPQAAVTNLKEKYAGDTKKLLKIDVAKDKIAELRLRQRVSGTFGVTAEVAARDRTIQTFENQALNRAVAKATPSFVRKVPKMWKPFWKIDELYANRKDRELQRAHVKMAATYGAGFCALAVFFPGGINYIKFGAPLVLVSHMAQRARRADSPRGRGRGAAAGAARMFCGDESRRRRGRRADVPWRATPGRRRG